MSSYMNNPTSVFLRGYNFVYARGFLDQRFFSAKKMGDSLTVIIFHTIILDDVIAVTEHCITQT